MLWDKCKEEFIKIVEIDKEKISSILKTVKLRLKYVKSADVNKENISFII